MCCEASLVWWNVRRERKTCHLPVFWFPDQSPGTGKLPQSGRGIQPGASAPGSLNIQQGRPGGAQGSMPSTLTNLLYHIVFSTKMRQRLISPELSENLYPYIGGVIRSEKGKLLSIGGTENHIHILAKFSPTVAMSDMMRCMKSSSSKWINENKRTRSRFTWQRGYAAFSVSESAYETVSNYIQNQERHHKKMRFQKELLLLLKKHNVEYDERYLWD